MAGKPGKDITDRSIFATAYDNDPVIRQRRLGFFYGLEINPSAVTNDGGEIPAAKVVRLLNGKVAVIFKMAVLTPEATKWEQFPGAVDCYHGVEHPYGTPHEAVTRHRVEVTWAEVKA